MRSASPLQLSTAARRWVTACVVMLWALRAWTSTLARIQGAQHFHQSPSLMSLGSPESSVSALNLSALLGAVFKPPSRSVFVHSQETQPDHAHRDLARHHHDAADARVVSVDAASPFDTARAELDASVAKATTLPWQPSVLTPPQTVAEAEAAHPPWYETPLWALKTSELRGLRRPPKSAA